MFSILFWLTRRNFMINGELKQEDPYIFLVVYVSFILSFVLNWYYIGCKDGCI